MIDEEDQIFKIGDLVCRTDLFNKYFIKNKKISKQMFNNLVGVVVSVNEFIITVKLLNDNHVYGSQGIYMRLESEMAESIQFDD